MPSLGATNPVRAERHWPPAVIAGAFQTGVLAVRTLKRRGVRVECFDCNPDYPGFRSVYGPAHLCPSPDREPEAWVRFMIDLAATLPARAVLISSSDQYVTAIAVVPDNPSDVSALADAVGSRQYVGGLTGGAADATATAIDAPGAPADAKAFSYSGTTATPTGPQVLKGEVVGFPHGKVFVVVLQAAYGDATHDVDVGAVAGAIDARLAAIPEAS